MLSPVIAALALFIPQTSTPFESFGPYNKAVPAPEALLGYKLGSRITTYEDQTTALYAIANAAPQRVKVISQGRTHEGRNLHLAFVSSPENIARLEDIRKEHEALANGEASGRSTVPIVWINETIHGNETASFESGMALLYNLAASDNKSVTDMLKKVVVIVNPVFNPDGHERFAVFYNSISTGSSDRMAYEMAEPGVIAGRTNHYRFDMNRDRISFSQAETRADVKEFERWHPQVYVDQHGQVETYFFPPNPMSVNANVERKRFNRWTDVFGRETAAAFDQYGYSYYVKDQFDLYYPGYLDSHTSLTGAIGMTHETDGGKTIAKERADGSVVTLRRGAEKHFTAAMAVIRAASKNAKELVESYSDFKKRAVSGEFAGKFQRAVVTSEDPRPLQRLADQLALAGIKSVWSKTFTQEDANDYWSGSRGKVTFPIGSLVIDMAQPNGPLAKALLEPQSDFEPEFYKAQQEKRKTAPEGETYPGPEGHEFYDWTGWALPYAHNLRAWWCESRPALPNGIQIATHEERSRVNTIINLPDSTSNVGWVMAYTDEEDLLAAAEMASQGIRVLSSNQPFNANEAAYPKATFLLLNERNEPGYQAKASAIAAKHHSTLLPLSTQYPGEGRYGAGSGYMSPIVKPNIAVVFGNPGSLGQVGALWYLIEQQFKLPFTPITTGALSGDLSKFTSIVVPAGSGATASAKLREWVSAGGCLVVLDQITWALGATNFVELEKIKGEPQGLPGSLFRAELDPRSFLSYGFPAPKEGKIELAVPISGNTFYQPKKTGGSIITLPADEKVKKLLTGWEFENETEKLLANTVWLQDVSVGRGHVILFTEDPTNRAMWPGLNKLLLNAIILGPN
ncbi:MAG: M14 family zinc carboxypeptidase [Fimbriimonas sp.]